MIIFITSYDKTEFINVSPTDSLNVIIEKYHLRAPNQLYFNGTQLIPDDDIYNDEEFKYNKKMKKRNKKMDYYMHYNHYKNFTCSKSFANFNIKNFDILTIDYHLCGGVFDNIKDEIDLKIGF